MEVEALLLDLGIAFILFVIFRWFIERFEIENLETRAVFITGCDSGFGRDLAIRCAEKGMPVFAGCLLEKSISEFQELSGNFRIPIDAFIVDVSSDDSVNNAKRYLEDKTMQYGGLHGLVNNAGILGNAFFDDFLTLKDYKTVAEVNTWGVIRVTHALKPLVKKTRGRIVTVTSGFSRIGMPGIGPYTTAKFALTGYCEVIRAELRLFGVSVHIIEPGFIKTRLTSAEIVEREKEHYGGALTYPRKISDSNAAARQNDNSGIFIVLGSTGSDMESAIWADGVRCPLERDWLMSRDTVPTSAEKRVMISLKLQSTVQTQHAEASSQADLFARRTKKDECSIVKELKSVVYADYAHYNRQLDELYSRCSEETRNEYGKEFFVQMRQKGTSLLSFICSNRIDLVTDAYFHALTAVYPRSRYQVNWDSILLYAPLSFLPTPVYDFLIRVGEMVLKFPIPAAMQKIKKS